jgi:hypothetical protein
MTVFENITKVYLNMQHLYEDLYRPMLAPPFTITLCLILTSDGEVYLSQDVRYF